MQIVRRRRVRKVALWNFASPMAEWACSTTGYTPSPTCAVIFLVGRARIIRSD